MKRSFLWSILYFVDRDRGNRPGMDKKKPEEHSMDYRNYDRGYAEPAMTASDYMARTYRWMGVGLLVTFAVAYLTATTPLLYVVDSLYLVLTIAELALVFMLSARVQNMSVAGARGLFFAYAALNGMVLSYYFLAFSVSTLVLAFLATALYFGLTAAYGMTTHRDLTGWGPPADDGAGGFDGHQPGGRTVWLWVWRYGAVQRHWPGGLYAAYCL